MAKFVVVLTDEAQANPERFLPFIEQTFGNQGCGNFEYLPAIGVINVDFPDKTEVNFSPIQGVLAIEPETVAYTQSQNTAGCPCCNLAFALKE